MSALGIWTSVLRVLQTQGASGKCPFQTSTKTTSLSSDLCEAKGEEWQRPPGETLSWAKEATLGGGGAGMTLECPTRESFTPPTPLRLSGYHPRPAPGSLLPLLAGIAGEACPQEAPLLNQQTDNELRE